MLRNLQAVQEHTYVHVGGQRVRRDPDSRVVIVSDYEDLGKSFPVEIGSLDRDRFYEGRVCNRIGKRGMLVESGSRFANEQDGVVRGHNLTYLETIARDLPDGQVMVIAETPLSKSNRGIESRKTARYKRARAYAGDEE